MAVLWSDFDGHSEEGIKRFRAPFRFYRSSEGDSIIANLTLSEDAVPAEGDPVEIDGFRYLVRQVRSHPIRLPDPPAASVELVLEEAV